MSTPAVLPTPLDELRDRAVVEVETAGRVLEMSRSAAYRAAARGDIPTIRLGKRIVVPTAPLLRMLGHEA